MKFVLLFLLTVTFGNINAQTRNGVGIIIGNVIELETGNAIAAATVTLQKFSDTTFNRNQVTDKNGNFDFESLATGYYRLVISSIGFTTVTLDSIHIRTERYDFNLGDVKLSKSTTRLQEVIVYAEKPLIENKDGNITYNVGESALSNGASTAEILKNMPLISNDPNGKILLKGKEPKILIDDKPTELNAQQLADLLESLPGNTIEKVELMTNPPPQFASQEGGVINIVTKKGKVGLVGRVTLSGGSRGEGNIAANVSYRQKKFTINSNVGLALTQFAGNNYSRRENYYKDSTNFFHTDGRFLNQSFRPNIRIQADYEITKKHSLNAVVQTNFNVFDNESNTEYKNLNRLSNIYRLSTRSNATQGLGNSNTFNITYTYRPSITSPERLQVIASRSFGITDNNRAFFQQFLHPDYSSTGVDSMQQQLIDNKNNNYSFRINYDKPLKLKGAILHTGASFDRINNHNIVNTQFYRKASQQFETNELLSNDFTFFQNIYTARAALSIRFKQNWRIIAGIQAEETNNNFRFVKGNAPNVSTGFLNWLPNLTLRKDFSKALNSSLVYRATIRRPGIGELNPNIDYSDPYNIRFGNPDLFPTLAHNIDWNFGLIKGKYYINTSIGYNKLQDVFNTIRTLADNGITQVTYQNIADRQEYEVSGWGGYTFSKRLRINASAGYTYNKYSEKEKQLYKYRDGSTFYTSINYSYTPGTLLTFEGNARYSSFADPQGRARSNLTMNLGVQRKLFSKRLIVSLNVIDPFRVQKFVTYTYGARFTLENYNSTNTRNFRISIAYQLNKMQQTKAPVKQKPLTKPK